MFELTKRNNSCAHPYNPFGDFEDLERGFFGYPFGFVNDKPFGGLKTDITDEGDHYLLEADLPGFDKKDINIDINGDTLTVSAQRRSRHEEKDEKDKIIRSERSYGSYTRQFDISEVNAEAIKAKYENGVLQLELPKKENALPKARRLEIE
ncbi:MAG: Hsp20/alpha crystallin family protein [Clostridia bacterium]|nr:Hsp20/alpha crystallin family protein [Clostridia bacterium]MBR6334774.1 Hsp20/alpha crystallin family protein [Clostridia bacterium]